MVGGGKGGCMLGYGRGLEMACCMGLVKGQGPLTNCSQAEHSCPSLGDYATFVEAQFWLVDHIQGSKAVVTLPFPGTERLIAVEVGIDGVGA